MGDPHMLPPQGGSYPDYQDDRNIPQGPPYDDSYQESPYHHQDYNAPPHNGQLEDDHYSDRHNDSLPPRHDESFQGMRPGDPVEQYNHPSYDQDRYSDVPRQRSSYDQDGPMGQHGMEDGPRYRGSYDHEGPGYGGPYGGPPLDDAPRYRGSYDHEDPQGQYGAPPPDDNTPPTYLDDHDRQGHSYGGLPPADEAPRYRGSYQDEPPPPDPNMYDETQHKFDGLPPVQSDPFADDPFRDQRSHDGSFSALREDPYNRGPSPYNKGPSPVGGSDIYGDRYYGEYSFDPIVSAWERSCRA